MAEMKNVLLVGCNGPISQLLYEQIQKSSDFTITYGFDKVTESKINIVVCNHFDAIPEIVDVIINCSDPSTTMEILPLAACSCAPTQSELSRPMVIAVDGFTPEQEQQISYYATIIPIFRPGGFCGDVNVTFAPVAEGLLQEAKYILDKPPGIYTLTDLFNDL